MIPWILQEKQTSPRQERFNVSQEVPNHSICAIQKFHDKSLPERKSGTFALVRQCKHEPDTPVIRPRLFSYLSQL